MFKYFLLSSFASGPQLAAVIGNCASNGVQTVCANVPPWLFPVLGVVWLLMLAVCIFTLVCLWKIFVKAGQKGWAAIIPVYNLYIMLKIINKPWWWIFLFFIPYFNVVMSAMLAYYMAKAFGKDGWFAVGIFFLTPVFYGILAFGKAVYQPLHADSLAGTPAPVQ